MRLIEKRRKAIQFIFELTENLMHPIAFRP